MKSKMKGEKFNKYLPVKTGSISFSKAPILLATHKCVLDWSASRAFIAYLP